MRRGFWSGSWLADGNYEARWLLLDELWSGGSFKVDGEIVASVAAGDLRLVNGSRNAEGIARVRELTADCRKQSPYHVTNALFVCRDGSFKPLGIQ